MTDLFHLVKNYTKLVPSQCQILAGFVHNNAAKNLKKKPALRSKEILKEKLTIIMGLWNNNLVPTDTVIINICLWKPKNNPPFY